MSIIKEYTNNHLVVVILKIQSLLNTRGIEQKGRAMLQRMVENRESGYRPDHLATREKRPLYREVSLTMDKIQNYLGHGSSRIDLAEVYLKGV